MTHWCVSQAPAPDVVQCNKTGWWLGYHLRGGCLAATCKTPFLVVVGWYFHQCFKFWCEVNWICSVSCSRWCWICRYFSISPLGIITVISDEEFEAPEVTESVSNGMFEPAAAGVPLGSVLGSTPVFPRASSLEALLKSTVCCRPDADTQHQHVSQSPCLYNIGPTPIFCILF